MGFVGNSCGTPTSTMEQQQQQQQQQQYGLGMTGFPQMKQHPSTFSSAATGPVSYAGPAPTPPPISPPGGDSGMQQMMPGTIGCNVPLPPAQMPGQFGCNAGGETPTLNNQMVFQMGQPQQQVYFDSFMPGNQQMPQSVPMAAPTDGSASMFISPDNS